MSRNKTPVAPLVHKFAGLSLDVAATELQAAYSLTCNDLGLVTTSRAFVTGRDIRACQRAVCKAQNVSIGVFSEGENGLFTATIRGSDTTIRCDRKGRIVTVPDYVAPVAKVVPVAAILDVAKKAVKAAKAKAAPKAKAPKRTAPAIAVDAKGKEVAAPV